jgi:hypothetical protein
MPRRDSDEFHLGKMVGETLGRISEQERIIALLEEVEISFFDDERDQIQTLNPDWTDLFKQIRREA